MSFLKIQVFTNRVNNQFIYVNRNKVVFLSRDIAKKEDDEAFKYGSRHVVILNISQLDKSININFLTEEGYRKFCDILEYFLSSHCIENYKIEIEEIKLGKSSYIFVFKNIIQYIVEKIS